MSANETMNTRSADDPAPLLDANAAGRLLNVPPTWVLAEARADRIPHVRLGRYVRFDADELRDWWHTRARGPWRANGMRGRMRINGS
jgi:excisionase family DNA binding protein